MSKITFICLLLFGLLSATAFSQQARMRAYPFELKDTLGYSHRLGDFKGKTIIMDFWFTGCKGCVQVARMLREQVKPAFEGDTSVVFIAVSLDINFLEWKRSIQSGIYTSEGQLNLFTNGLGANHPIYPYYGFSGAPQMLVIDQEGFVVSRQIMYNSPEIIKLIKESANNK